MNLDKFKKEYFSALESYDALTGDPNMDKRTLDTYIVKINELYTEFCEYVNTILSRYPDDFRKTYGYPFPTYRPDRYYFSFKNITYGRPVIVASYINASGVAYDVCKHTIIVDNNFIKHFSEESFSELIKTQLEIYIGQLEIKRKEIEEKIAKVEKFL